MMKKHIPIICGVGASLVHLLAMYFMDSIVDVPVEIGFMVGTCIAVYFIVKSSMEHLK